MPTQNTFCNLAPLYMMQIRVYFLIVIISSAMLWMSCANESNPSGGPKDTTPPKLMTRNIADSSLRFKGGKVSFEFDEKIDANNIVVETFPIMRSKPKVVVNKKTLTLILPDSLLEENTTYKISLGNSIKDIYEGNPYNSLSFTFSTGDVLDTMMLSGNVWKANSGDADTNAWVMLYKKIESDSDISKQKPLYASKVDAMGAFSFSNLPNKEFYLYAVGDANKNLKYDYPLESIAYLSTSVLPVNNLNAKIFMHSFLEVADTTISKSVADRWKKNVFKGFTTNIDTTDIKKRSFDITQPITITAGNKIIDWNKSKIRFYADDVLDETGFVVADSITNKIKINTEMAQDAIYKLVLLDSFATDTSGEYKGNTYTFRTKKESDYGTLKLKYATADASYNHIMQLWQNGNMIATQIIKDSVVNFKLLNPGNYVIRILHDKNNNGVWDNGNYYSEKMQPEIVEKYASEIVIKANWLNTIDWNIVEKNK